MPSNFDEFELPTRMGGLDTESIAAGEPANAFHLRELAVNANRAITKYDTMFGYCWDARALAPGEGETDVTSDRFSVAMPTTIEWVRWLPVPLFCPKMPGHNRVNVHVCMDVSENLAGGQIEMMLFDERLNGDPPAPGDSRILSFTEAGEDFVSVNGIEVPEGPYVLLNFWLRGIQGGLRGIYTAVGFEDDAIFTDLDDGFVPYERAAQGHAVRLSSILTVSGDSPLSPAWTLTNVAAGVHPSDPGVDAQKLTLAEGTVIPAIWKRIGVLAQLYKMPGFVPRSIIVESWRAFA